MISAERVLIRSQPLPDADEPAVLVTGAPGSGRTSLLDAAAARRWRRVVRLDGPDLADLPSLLAGFERERQPEPTGYEPPHQPAGQAVAGVAPARLLETVEALAAELLGAAGELPALVAVDDLHLAAPTVQQLLSLVILRCAGPVRFLLTACDSWPERSNALADGAPVPGVSTRLGLAPLSLDELVELAGQRLQAVPDDRLMARIDTDLGSCAGLPGPVLELLDAARDSRVLVSAGRAFLLDRTVPLAFGPASAAGTRLAGLGPDAVAVYGVLSELGMLRPREIDTVGSVLGLRGERVAEAVRSLCDSGLVSDQSGRLRPAVPALAAQPPLPGALVDAVCVAILSRFPGLVGSDPPRAADLLVRSRPTEVTPDRGAALIELAAIEQDSAPLRAARWCALVALHGSRPELREQGGTAELTALSAAGAWQRCATRARQLLATELSPAGIVAATSRLHYALCELGLDAEAEASLTAAMAPLPEQVGQQMAGYRARLAITTGDFGRAEALLRDQLATDQAAWPAQFGMLILDGIAGRGSQLRTRQQRLAQAARVRADPTAADQALTAIGTGDFRSAELALLTVTHPLDGVLRCHRDAVQALAGGRWDDVVRAACEVPAYPVSGLVRYSASVTRLLAAEVSLRRGDLIGAAEWLLPTEPELPFGFLVDWVRAGLAAAAGRPGEAVAVALAGADRAAAAGHGAGLDVLYLRAIEAAVEGSVEPAGEPRGGQVEHAVTALSELSDRLDTVHSKYCLARSLALARRDPVAADRALALAGELGQPYESARSQLTAAGLGSRPEEHLHAAYLSFQQLGAQPGLLACSRLLTELGLSKPAAERSTQATDVRTTAVLELVALGLTNSQIARRVGLSEKSVERYVRELIRQAGVRSRVGLARAWIGGRVG